HPPGHEQVQHQADNEDSHHQSHNGLGPAQIFRAQILPFTIAKMGLRGRPTTVTIRSIGIAHDCSLSKSFQSWGTHSCLPFCPTYRIRLWRFFYPFKRTSTRAGSSLKTASFRALENAASVSTFQERTPNALANNPKSGLRRSTPRNRFS